MAETGDGPRYRPLVFVGPSGIGKGTILHIIMEKHPELFGFSVSHTTRAPRAGETDGVEYYFTTREKMEQQIANGEFLEYADSHGNLYGTSKAAIESVINSGKICVLDVNVDGAVAISKTNFKPFIIFLRPVSMELLEQRLRGRGTESEEAIQRRMTTARREMALHEELKGIWDLDIVNDKLEDTLAIIKAELKKLYGFDPSA
jgi:guanylate kinase